jgi:hypothetical protein
MSCITVDEFNNKYRDKYRLDYTIHEMSMTGDFILIDLFTGFPLMTVLNKSIADVPYYSDVPEDILLYVREHP